MQVPRCDARECVKVVALSAGLVKLSFRRLLAAWYRGWERADSILQLKQGLSKGSHPK